MASFGQRLPATGGTVEYRANGKTVVTLSRDQFYRSLLLRLAMAPTVTALNNTAADTGEGDEWAIVEKIKLKAGSLILREVTGPELRWMNANLHGLTPRTTSTIGDGVTANPFVFSSLLLPIFPPFVVSPFELALNAPNFSNDLTLEIEWGDHTNVNANATGFTTAPTLNVEMEWNNGPIVSLISSQLMLQESVPVTTLVGGHRLPTDNAIRGMWLRAKTSAGLDSPFVFNTADTVDNLLKVRTANVPVIEAEVSKLMDETRQLQVQSFVPRNDKEKADAHMWIDFLHERPGFVSESLPTVTFLPNGQVRSLDQIFLTFESLASFTNASDVVDIYMWRVPNPAPGSN